jgi:hypothetical protein
MTAIYGGLSMKTAIWLYMFARRQCVVARYDDPLACMIELNWQSASSAVASTSPQFAAALPRQFIHAIYLVLYS